MVRLALFVLLAWMAAAIPLAVLLGTVLRRLNDSLVPAPVVVRRPRRIVDLRSR